MSEKRFRPKEVERFDLLHSDAQDLSLATPIAARRRLDGEVFA